MHPGQIYIHWGVVSEDILQTFRCGYKLSFEMSPIPIDQHFVLIKQCFESLLMIILIWFGFRFMGVFSGSLGGVDAAMVKDRCIWWYSVWFFVHILLISTLVEFLHDFAESIFLADEHFYYNSILIHILKHKQ